MNADWEVTGDNTYFRKARKAHRCSGGHDGTKRTSCDKPIPAGSHYVEYVGETGPYHHECAAQQGLIRRIQTVAT